MPRPGDHHDLDRREARHDVRRIIDRDHVYATLRMHHYRWLGDPAFVRGHYVVKVAGRFGRPLFVEVDPYTGAFIGESASDSELASGVRGLPLPIGLRRSRKSPRFSRGAGFSHFIPPPAFAPDRCYGHLPRQGLRPTGGGGPRGFKRVGLESAPNIGDLSAMPDGQAPPSKTVCSRSGGIPTPGSGLSPYSSPLLRCLWRCCSCWCRCWACSRRRPIRAPTFYAVNRPIAFTFLDADGNDVGHRGAVVGERLHLQDMPAYLPAAFIAMEDRRFYAHRGIDPRGLLRALFVDLRARQWGGGRLNHQPADRQDRLHQPAAHHVAQADRIDGRGRAWKKPSARNRFWSSILNRIYLGSDLLRRGRRRGAPYFGTSARNVSLAQAAMLATLTRAPSVFSPRRDLLRAQQRASLVLDAMVETGAITEDQAADARAHPAIVIDRASLDARNFFLDTAADQAKNLAAKDGVAPTSRSDRAHHAGAQTAGSGPPRRPLRAIAKFGKRQRVGEAAVVMMKPDGAVSALIGGIDYQKFGVQTAPPRRAASPARPFKPFVYLTALKRASRPGTSAMTKRSTSMATSRRISAITHTAP